MAAAERAWRACAALLREYHEHLSQECQRVLWDNVLAAAVLVQPPGPGAELLAGPWAAAPARLRTLARRAAATLDGLLAADPADLTDRRALLQLVREQEDGEGREQLVGETHCHACHRGVHIVGWVLRGDTDVLLFCNACAFEGCRLVNVADVAQLAALRCWLALLAGGPDADEPQGADLAATAAGLDIYCCRNPAERDLVTPGFLPPQLAARVEALARQRGWLGELVTLKGAARGDVEQALRGARYLSLNPDQAARSLVEASPLVREITEDLATRAEDISVHQAAGGAQQEAAAAQQQAGPSSSDAAPPQQGAQQVELPGNKRAKAGKAAKPSSRGRAAGLKAQQEATQAAGPQSGKGGPSVKRLQPATPLCNEDVLHLLHAAAVMPPGKRLTRRSKSTSGTASPPAEAATAAPSMDAAGSELPPAGPASTRRKQAASSQPRQQEICEQAQGSGAGTPGAAEASESGADAAVPPAARQAAAAAGTALTLGGLAAAAYTSIRDVRIRTLLLLGAAQRFTPVHCDPAQACTLALAVDPAGLEAELAQWLFIPRDRIHDEAVRRLFALGPKELAEVGQALRGGQDVRPEWQQLAGLLRGVVLPVFQRHNQAVNVWPGAFHIVVNLQPCLKVAVEPIVAGRFSGYATMQVASRSTWLGAPSNALDYAYIDSSALEAACWTFQQATAALGLGAEELADAWRRAAEHASIQAAAVLEQAQPKGGAHKRSRQRQQPAPPAAPLALPPAPPGDPSLLSTHDLLLLPDVGERLGVHALAGGPGEQLLAVRVLPSDTRVSWVEGRQEGSTFVVSGAPRQGCGCGGLVRCMYPSAAQAEAEAQRDAAEAEAERAGLEGALRAAGHRGTALKALAAAALEGRTSDVRARRAAVNVRWQHYRSPHSGCHVVVAVTTTMVHKFQPLLALAPPEPRLFGEGVAAVAWPPAAEAAA